MAITIRSPVTRKKLSDFVEEELERVIRQGEIAEGGSLPSERELMAMFDVGRPSIREALTALSHKGLVKISTGERAKVTRPSADTIIATLSGISKDFLSKPEGIRYFEQLRQFFESSLVRYAATHATDEQIDALKAALDTNQEAIDDAEMFAQTDIFFHRVIAEIPGNPIFVAVHQAVVDWLINLRPKPPKLREQRQRNFREHTAIYDSIREKNPEAGDDAVQIHLRHLYDVDFGRQREL